MGRIGVTTACAVLVFSLTGAVSTASAAGSAVASAELPLPPAGRDNIGYSVVTQGAFNGTGQLVLVGPDGGRRTLGATGVDESVVDLSNDARTVLTVTPLASARQSITTWDLAAGTKSSWPIGLTTTIAFVEGGILTVDYPTGVTQVRSVVNGAVLTPYPTVPSQSVTTVTPTGDRVLQRVPAGVAVRRASNGSVIQTVPDAPGYIGCVPRQLWTSSAWTRSWVMSCLNNNDPALPRQYRVTFAFGSVAAITPPGAEAVWATSPVRVVRIPEATGIPNYLGFVSGDGFGSLNLPGEPDDPQNRVIAARETAIWVLWNGTTGTSLRRYNVATKQLTSLIGPGSSSPIPITSARTVDALT